MNNNENKDFYNFFLEHQFDQNIFNDDGTINPKYNSFKKTGVIAQIFEDHFDMFYNNNKDLIDLYRSNAYNEIHKIIDCHNKNLGFSTYICPKCNDAVFIGHTCKSRLCSSCGYKYKNSRVEKIMQTAYNCEHRQIVFTIPKELRKYFFHPFDKRIDILFKAVRDTIYSIFNEYYKYNKKLGKLKKYKKKIKQIPGFFAFLHTFGRDLKFNPHIHILIAELSLSENGFYVYAEKKKFKSLKEGIEYVTRYCGRAPISENRIINYDGKNVTFCYNAHEDDSYHELTVTIEEFIFMILRHLIPTQYKIIRYYGFYRKKHKLHDKMIMLIDKAKHNIRNEFLKYKLSILKSFNRSPYDCPKCGTKLEFAFEVT